MAHPNGWGGGRDHRAGQDGPDRSDRPGDTCLVEGISAPIVVPGYFHSEREATAMDAAGAIVSDVCSDNGSGIVVMAEYGG